MSEKLIINADDFGFDSNVNAAIVACFQKDIINSTTIMANMPGFDEAVVLAKKHNLTTKIGLHVNLTEGKSLTDLTGTGLTDSEGFFIKNAVVRRRFSLSVELRTKLRAEIEAQYNKLIQAGIQPTHFDSHLHIHILPHLLTLFVEFTEAKNQKLRIVTVTKRKNVFIMIYNTFLNMYYKSKNIHFTDKFGNVGFFKNYLLNNTDFSPVFEIMVHPAYNGEELVEIHANINIENRINEVKSLYSKKILQL